MPDTGKGTCLVVMGFGKKTDFETGRTLDLDASYRNIIKPAVQAAGLTCIRADEILHSGRIDLPLYEHLLSADVVVADLSASNKNALYELGVRHALRPSTTVVISEDGMKTFPFDFSHVAVRQYHHMGDGIDFDEVMRFRQILTDAIVNIMSRQPRPVDSPVYTLLEGLIPPQMPAGDDSVEAAEEAASSGDGTAATTHAGSTAQGESQTHSALMRQADEAQKRGDFITARSYLTFVRSMMKAEAPGRPEDPYVIQRLALVTYKSKFPTEEVALKEARDLLASIGPETSNDTETLGLWGTVNRRLWDLTTETPYLNEAVRGYERGFYIRNDYYNGINLAFLLNVRAASAADEAEAIADFVQARRARREVISICEKLLSGAGGAGQKKAVGESEKYWVFATLAEAHFGLGDEATAQRVLDEAASAATESWMKFSTQEQLEKLRGLLAASPLKYVSRAAARE